jgi:cation transport ATPase
MKQISNILKSIILALVLFIYASTCFGQQKKSDTAIIQTSAVCGMCKDRIEGALAFEKGVKSSTLDSETKELTVIFNPTRTSKVQLQRAVSKLGYDADSIPANQSAYNKLPACCKKDAPKHD